MKAAQRRVLFVVVLLVSVAAIWAAQRLLRPETRSLAPTSLPLIGRVNDRFQSYNVEMVEVTGGQFWRPYDAHAAGPGAVPGHENAARYAWRPPTDFHSAKLRRLAAALGPAFLRVSGTWANASYFSDTPAVPQLTPKGFIGVFARPQWQGVVDFAHAANDELVTSFAVSAGVRDASGTWKSDDAGRLVDFTRSIGGHIYGAEFMNEPDLADLAGVPAGYDAERYGRDFAIFRNWIEKSSPGTKIIGPGSIGEAGIAPWFLRAKGSHLIDSGAMLAASPGRVAIFSYHHYGAMSERCASRWLGGTSLGAALSEGWLASVDQSNAYYTALRDRYAPGAPLWLTETGEAACGGDPWASRFADSFRYLDQLGRLARQGVQVVMHNTLDAGDYALLDAVSFRPRPDYWAAWLWHRFMGSRVLDAGVPADGLNLYAHCLRDVPGGVAILAINLNRDEARSLMVSSGGERYTLTAASLEASDVALNGAVLELGANDAMPAIQGTAFAPESLHLPPASISFLAVPGAGNKACY